MTWPPKHPGSFLGTNRQQSQTVSEHIAGRKRCLFVAAPWHHTHLQVRHDLGGLPEEQAIDNLQDHPSQTTSTAVNTKLKACRVRKEASADQGKQSAPSHLDKVHRFQ